MAYFLIFSCREIISTYFYFYYFSMNYFVPINNNFFQNNQNVPIPEENTIIEIHSVLSSFISSNAEAWAPIISAWSLDLLGNLKKY